jgi:4-hydroxythreonine-4-phosphate dehydrogenase
MSLPPRLAVSMGDPAGIGPEVIVRALADPKVAAKLRAVVVGDPAVMQRAVRTCRVPLHVVPVEAVPVKPLARGVLPVLTAGRSTGLVVPGRWTRATGAASLAAVTRAADLVRSGDADALVTAPICKQAWQAAGANAPGHTELLARLTGAKDYAMMFVGGPFRLVLATIHEPLARVPQLLTPDRIVRVALCGARELRRRFGAARPRLAVAGLNPHAGEGGLFGDEERRLVAPAVRKLARRRDLTVTGPLAPDTLFAQALDGRWDLIVCLYHDQGLIPFKLLALHSGVNVTAGLPIIRTSPDHGTAFDLAGTGRADPGSMAAALRTAAEMVRQERKTQ